MFPLYSDSSFFEYTFLPKINVGYITSFWLYGSSMYNYNYINTDHFGYSYLYNSGILKCTSYDCTQTDNHGTIFIKSDKKNNLGEFRIKENGVLNLNNVNITSMNTLHPDIKKYLENTHNGTIEYEADCIVLKGSFHFNIKEVRQILPHLYGKYTNENSWLYDQVSSRSKRNGRTKYWKNKNICDEYPLQTAIRDIFKHRLLNKIFGPEIAPKAKFDSFSKTVVFRKSIDKNLVGTGCKDKFKTTLQKHLIEKIISDKPDGLLRSLDEISQKANKPNDANHNQLSFFQKISSFFYDSNNDPMDIVNKEITKENLIDNLTELTALLSKNDFEKCCQVKDAICKNVTENGSKFTKEQIEDEIVPQIDETVLTIEKNISVLKDYINTFDSQDKDELKSDPTIEILESNGTLASSETQESSETLESNETNKSRLLLK